MFLPYLVSILAGICYGVTEAINKNITEEKYSSFAYAFLQHFLIFVIYLIPAIYYFRWPAEPASFIYLILTILITLSANTLDIKAYKTEDISNITIVGNINLVITFLTGVFFLSELASPSKIVGLAAILAGVTIIFYQGRKFVLTYGLIFAFLSGVIWGFSGLVDKLGLSTIDIITYAVLTQGPLALMLLFHSSVRRDVPKIWKKYSRKIIVSRVFVVVGLFLFYWSIQRAAISVIRTNSSTFFLLSTISIGIIFLNERKHLLKKLIGCLVCILGIILLNLF